MKILKVLLYIILAVVILGAIGWFIKKDYDVHRTVTINASPEMVSEYVAEFRNWPNWMPWIAMDKDMEINFEEQSKGVGARYTWVGDTAGTGSLEIIEYTPGNSMKTELVFTSPFESQSNGYWLFKEVEGGTEVTWGNTGKVPMLMTLGMDMDQMMGNDFQKGLENLKAQVEAYKAAKEKEAIVWEEFMMEPVPYFYIERSMKISEMSGDIFGDAYGRIMEYIGGPDAMTGAPFALYTKWDEENDQVSFQAGIPSDVKKNGSGDIKRGVTYEGLALKNVYKGPYDGVGPVHENFETYSMENGYEYAGPGAFEIYVTDPSMEPDTSKWITEIIYPVKKMD
ncbi:MAG: SRPBCC family protein [Bacteroidota bacterium]|nr:SRPBCC family protein [Bacteroidota bacterium]